MAIKFLIVGILCQLLALSLAKNFRSYSNCPFPVWVGILGNSGKPAPANGGFRVDTWTYRDVDFPDDWAGRFWGRTDCDENTGHCVTGDCGNKIECGGAGGIPPVSLAEITLTGWQNQDYYDISLVDGYNLPMQIKPVNGKQTGRPDSHYDCTVSGCNSDLNVDCPSELAVVYNGYTVACMSACEKFQTDEYCCRGDHGTPDTCKSSDWPVNYPAIFKAHCPDAYSYAYDDAMSTFTCASDPGTSYEVIFCPPPADVRVNYTEMRYN